MNLFRLLLFPFSILYGFAILLRNYAYDKGIFHSTKFKIPLISIGNLAVGGAGKSPMTEYIIRLLKDRYQVATLNRGYGRQTSGFIELDLSSTSEQAGDEPLQFKRKFPDVSVAVCEDRAAGIRQLEGSSDLILMDDAYQHRAVTPGLSLLLFDFENMFKPPMLLPTGNLREPLSERKRADIIVITKTPLNLTESDAAAARSRIKPLPHQKMFFSYLEYGDLTSLGSERPLPLSTINKSIDIILLTGIANPMPLLNELSKYTSSIDHHKYPDHHRFSSRNIAKLAASYSALKSLSKFIITTEKDAQRLRLPILLERLDGLPVYYLPIKARFHKPGDEELKQIIENYVAKHLQHN